MVQLLSLKLLQSMKKIEDLLLVNSELQKQQHQPRKQEGGGVRESTAIFKDTTNFGCMPLDDTNLIKIEQIGDDKQQRADQPVNHNTSTTTGGCDDNAISPEMKKEKIGAAQQSVQALLMNNELDRKWVQYVNKIFNALHSMDKQKYLEPKFSISLHPIIKFLQKRKGTYGGSAATNISKLSFRDGSQINGENIPGANFANMLSGFNDSFSGLLGSFTSHLDSKNKEMKSNEMTKMKMNSNIPQSESVAVIEQMVEEDEDYPMKAGNNRKNNSINATMLEQSFRNDSLMVHRILQPKESPLQLEPVLEGKRSSRTINGINTNQIAEMKLELLLNGGGGPPLMKINNHNCNESQLSNQSLTYHESNISTGAAAYQRQYQKNTPRSQVAAPQKKKVIAQRNVNLSYYSNSTNSGAKQNQPQTLLESAYRTTSNGFNLYNNQQAFKNFTNQNTLSTTNNSHQNKVGQQKKSQRLIRTLIERKNAHLNNSQMSQQPQLNKDVSHVEDQQPRSSTSHVNVDASIEQDSPNNAVVQSYYNNSHTSQVLNSKGPQYSQVTIKQTNNDYENNNEIATGMLSCNNLMGQSTGFMISRAKKGNQAQFKQIVTNEKKKSRSTHGGTNKLDYKKMASIIFDDVYNSNNPDKMLTRIANNQLVQSRSAQKRSTNWEAQSNNDINQNSQRSLHSNYLQNLNELVKIHNEMKQSHSRQRQRLVTTTTAPHHINASYN